MSAPHAVGLAHPNYLNLLANAQIRMSITWPVAHRAQQVALAELVAHGLAVLGVAAPMRQRRVPHGYDALAVAGVEAQPLHHRVQLVEAERAPPAAAVGAVDHPVMLREPRPKVPHEVVEERGVPPTGEHP